MKLLFLTYLNNEMACKCNKFQKNTVVLTEVIWTFLDLLFDPTI